VVTLVILPDMPVPRPEPSPGLLKIVRRYLEQRRIVGTRLTVVGPSYLEVNVVTHVQLRSHTDPRRVRDAIDQALRGFFDPRIGGPGGLGWPFGRDVYRSEVMELIDGVPGVDHVLSLSLRAGAQEPQCGNLTLCPTWLVVSGQHQIII
jgi:hypothetical protein